MNTPSLTTRLTAAAGAALITFGLLSATVSQAGLASPAPSMLLAQAHATSVVR